MFTLGRGGEVGGGGQREGRGATVHKRGRKYQHDWLYSISSLYSSFVHVKGSEKWKFWNYKNDKCGPGSSITLDILFFRGSFIFLSKRYKLQKLLWWEVRKRHVSSAGEGIALISARWQEGKWRDDKMTGWQDGGEKRWRCGKGGRGFITPGFFFINREISVM